MLKQIRKWLHSFVTVACILSLGACSTIEPTGFYRASRLPASTDVEKLDYYLAVDRLHYYMTEFASFHSGKQDEAVIDALQSITAKQVLDENIPYAKLSDPDKFDTVIQDILKKYYPDIQFKKSELVWNYNFLKRKLTEAYTLKESRLAKVYKNVEADDLVGEIAKEITITDVTPETLTLDSGHYISNRTTRAVFWEAVENDRTIEFHLGEAREFVKNVEARGGEVLYEVNPMARNYNKIFLVRYPGETEHRVAITNIGGHDRLDHLVHQISLSNLSSKKIVNKVKIIGDLDDFHERLSRKIKGRLELLPKADRLVIGQKGAIDGIFTLQWKKRALQNLYAEDPDSVISAFDLDDSKIKEIIDGDGVISALDNKSKIEKAFAKVESKFEAKPELYPAKFKELEWDLNVAEMADYVFKNAEGKDVRWRVVSNVWGDEIVPVAKALKELGQDNVTYIGTAGAFPDKGYKVGDLVIPSHYLDAKGKIKARGTPLEVEGAKVGGVVEHVASPFDETFQWLSEASQRSDLVEIETNYLGRIFGAQNDHVRSYLLVSDILGSEGETLASASSSKRRNSLNKLLEALYSRDSALFPTALDKPKLTGDALKAWNKRAVINEALPKAGASYRYHLFSTYEGPNTINGVLDHADSIPVFTDNFHSSKLVEASEALTVLVNKIRKSEALPNLALPINFLDGKWNPKTDPLRVSLLASNAQTAQKYKAALEEVAGVIDPLSRWLTVDVITGPPPSDMAKIKVPSFVDADLLIRAYSDGAYARFGLDSLNTYTGNPKYVELPTIKSSSVCDTAAKFCSLSYFEPDAQTRALLEELPTFEQLGSSISSKKALEEAVADLSHHLASKGNMEEFAATAELKIVNSLPDGKLAEIVPEFSPTKGLIVKVNITQAGIKNPGVVLEEIAHLYQIMGDYFQHPIYWAEMTLNAKHGSRRAQHFLAKAEIDAMDLILDGQVSDVDVTPIQNYFESRKANAEKVVSNIKTMANQENKSRRNFGKQWKQMQTALEAQNLKLDDYIAKNNRKKVKEMIEAFMPWEEMEPVEVASWTRWLDAMTEQVPESKKVVLFRGLSGDLVRRNDAGEPFLMAKLLTKNQGNYTRRLRSLKTYRSKMATKAAGEIPSDPSSLTMVMKAHSHDPFGSPFMSAADMNIANTFIDGFESGSDKAGIAAININPNRLIQNVVSTYGENERLIPMILFPDEIAHLEEFSDEVAYNRTAFQSRVEDALGRKLKASEKSIGSKDRLAATKAWWELVNPEGLNPSKVSRTCKDVMTIFAQATN